MSSMGCSGHWTKRRAFTLNLDTYGGGHGGSTDFPGGLGLEVADVDEARSFAREAAEMSQDGVAEIALT